MPRFQVDEISGRLSKLAPPEGVVLVAIDGLGGAGKSTLARELSESLGAQVIAGDDFYRVMSDSERLALTPEEGAAHNFDWQRLRDQALGPLREGRAAEYEQYDWELQRLGPTRRVKSTGIVLVEGVGSFRPELRPLYDFSIFVDTPREVCLQRLSARGNSQEWINRWAASEDWYVAHTKPEKAVGVVVGCVNAD